MNTTRTFAALAALLCSASFAAGAHAAPVQFRIDPDHTYPSFEADHMGISTWRGKLTRTTGSVTLDRAAGSGSVELALDPASIDFGLPALNAWATGAEFFDIAKHPKASYSGRLEGFANGVPTRVTGTLTLHGVTRPVALTIERFKCMPHPMLKREWCGADASARFDRDAFGLGAGKDYGFRMDVLLRIQVEAVAAE